MSIGRAPRREAAERGGHSTVSLEEMAQLATAIRDIATIRSEAEAAADRVLALCETLMEACERDEAAGLSEASALREAVEQAAIEIMTACSFGDLIGQRSSKIAAQTETVLGNWLKRLPSGSADMRGLDRDALPPDVEDEPLSQDRIDRMLSEKN